jgi:iron complex transport system substrate-binding protein
MVAGNWIPELVEFAGGIHQMTVAGVHSGYTSWADLIRYNPEVIIVMPCGFGLDRSQAEARMLADRPNWLELEAVRTNRVFAVDGNAYFNRSGPRLVETLELLAHLIHPDIFDLSRLSLNPAYQSV